MLAFWNGEFVEAAEIGLSIADAGLVYAATVTDFCRTYRQRLFRWPQHLARFRHDCHRLDLPLHYGDEQLTDVAEELIRRNTQTLPPTQELALISVATPGPLGYLLGESTNGPPTLVMHCLPLNPARYQHLSTQGAVLELVGVLPSHPAGLVPLEVKHRNRLSWWLAERKRRHPKSLACLTDESFCSPDTAIGSVLLAQEGVVYRSPHGRVLESVSLGVVEELVREIGWRFEERRLAWPEFGDPNGEVLLCGSGFGLAGVRELLDLQGASFFPRWPGPMLQRLQAAWHELTEGAS